MFLGKVRLMASIRVNGNRLRIWMASVTCIATLLAAGCMNVSRISFDEDLKTATRGSDAFHKMFNEQKFDEIFNSTDERARQTKSKDALIALLSNLRNDRGPVMESGLTESKIEVRPSYREVHTTYRTKFEKVEAIEKFVWYVSDGKARLFSYETE